MSSRLNGLTILRFFAALWVLLLHLQYRAPLDLGPWLTRVVYNGAFAMSFFFVLSGTVLAYGYRNLPARSDEVLQFYRARLARIYPAYLVVHLLALPLMIAALPGEWRVWIFVNGLSALGIQAWFPHTMAIGINDGTWSISTEFFFYALFPAVLPALIWIVRRAGLARTAFYVVLLSGFVGLADYIFNGKGTALYYSLPAQRLPEFLLGMVIGLTLVEAPTRNRAWWPRLLAAVAAAVAAAGVSTGGLWMRANIVVVPAFGALIYTVARTEQQWRPEMKDWFPRSLVYLGESSYCLFLFQLIPLNLASTPAGLRWSIRFLTTHSPLLFWLMFIAGCVTGAVALHELVEKPARRFLLRRWQPKSAAVAAPARPVAAATIPET